MKLINGERMKIAHQVNNLSAGGTHKSAILFAIDQKKQGNESHILFHGEDRFRSKWIEDNNVGLVDYSGEGLYKSLTDIQPDIIHLHRAGKSEPEYIDPVRKYKSESGCKVIETNVFGEVDRRDPEAVDMHLFMSDYSMRRYRSQGGTGECDVIYNPIASDYFDADVKCPEERSRCARHSRNDDSKWDRIMTDAFIKFCRVVPDAHLATYGYTDAMKTALDPVKDNVTYNQFTVHDPTLIRLLQESDIYVHSCHFGESFGISMVEALAVGLPVITHPTPTMSDNAQVEIITPDVGFICNDADEYYKAMLSLYSDDELYKDLSFTAKSYAQKYRLETLSNKLLDIYRSL